MTCRELSIGWYLFRGYSKFLNWKCHNDAKQHTNAGINLLSEERAMQEEISLPCSFGFPSCTHVTNYNALQCCHATFGGCWDRRTAQERSKLLVTKIVNPKCWPSMSFYILAWKLQTSTRMTWLYILHGENNSAALALPGINPRGWIDGYIWFFFLGWWKM